MRESVLKCLGDFPIKASLNLSIVEEVDKGSYIQQLIEYNVEIDERVKSYLLIPKSVNENVPGVLAIHQHGGVWRLGKSEVVGIEGDAMFAYGVDLVKRGFVVIAPDLLCFEDRIDEDFKKDKNHNKAYERLKFCEYIQNGSSLQTKYIHDLSVAIDVLENLNFVNGDIGVIGHSLGGQESVWITWFDDRVKACASSCGIGLISDIFKNKILHNFALYVPGLAKVCDMDELINQISPRPIFITSGIDDEHHFPIKGINQIENMNKFNPNFISLKFEGGHSFEDAEKNRVYNWLERELFKKSSKK